VFSTFVYLWLSRCLLADLLHITGIGHGASGLGVGFQHTPPPEPEPRRPAASSTMGSDILDSNSHELKLEKSNILLLGPTGSGL
jgi:ATP-dependent Clp protease ATP-binding subunit ClpX